MCSKNRKFNVARVSKNRIEKITLGRVGRVKGFYKGAAGAGL